MTSDFTTDMTSAVTPTPTGAPDLSADLPRDGDLHGRRPVRLWGLPAGDGTPARRRHQPRALTAPGEAAAAAAVVPSTARGY